MNNTIFKVFRKEMKQTQLDIVSILSVGLNHDNNEFIINLHMYIVNRMLYLRSELSKFITQIFLIVNFFVIQNGYYASIHGFGDEPPKVVSEFIFNSFQLNRYSIIFVFIFDNQCQSRSVKNDKFEMQRS